jgi:hypothetical protein
MTLPKARKSFGYQSFKPKLNESLVMLARTGWSFAGEERSSKSIPCSIQFNSTSMSVEN